MLNSPIERLNQSYFNRYVWVFLFLSHLHQHWVFSYLKIFSKTKGKNSILVFHPLKLTKIKFLITLLVRVWGNSNSLEYNHKLLQSPRRKSGRIYKTKNTYTPDLVIPLLGNYHTDTFSYMSNDLCIRILLQHYFIKANDGK